MKTPTDPRIERARTRLIIDAPFFGALMVRLPVVPGYERPTFCTNGVRIAYNQEFADSLTDAEIRWLLCHEIIHCAMGHLWRIQGRDLALWNQACDYVVNQMLDDYAADCVKAGREVPWERPQGFLDVKDQPQWRGLSPEEIYRDMVGKQQPPPPQNSQAGSGGGSGPQPGQSQGEPEPGDGDDAGKGENVPCGKGENVPCGPGDFEAPPADEAKEGQEAGAESGLEEDWKIAAAQAEQIAHMRGNCPGAASQLAHDLKNPKIDWRDVLREFVNQRAAADYSFRRINKRHWGRGFILPSLYSEKVGRIVFAFDSSGSTRRYADAYATEIQAALDQVKPDRVDVIVCDAQVHSVTSFEEGDAVTIDAEGGGGTDFRPVFEIIDDPKHAAECEGELEEEPLCLVYLTDLDGSFPAKAPNYAVLWIAVNAKGREAPFGETIHV